MNNCPSQAILEGMFVSSNAKAKTTCIFIDSVLLGRADCAELTASLLGAIDVRVWLRHDYVQQPLLFIAVVDRLEGDLVTVIPPWWKHVTLSPISRTQVM